MHSDAPDVGGAAGTVPVGLNALSGIGCIRTFIIMGQRWLAFGRVLMPCRALDAFGPSAPAARRKSTPWVLMPCRALDAFGRPRANRQADGG